MFLFRAIKKLLFGLSLLISLSAYASNEFPPEAQSGFYMYAVAYGETCGFEWDADEQGDPTLLPGEYLAKFDCSGAFKAVVYRDGSKIFTLINGVRCDLQRDWDESEPATLLASEYVAKFDCNNPGSDFTFENNRIYADNNGTACGLQWDGDLGEPATLFSYERVAKFDCANIGHEMQYTERDEDANVGNVGVKSGDYVMLRSDSSRHIDCSRPVGQGPDNDCIGTSSIYTRALRIRALDRKVGDAVRSGDRVAFYAGSGREWLWDDTEYYWLSCWVSGSDCISRSCPGSWPGNFNSCRGETFWIYAKDKGCQDVTTGCTGNIITLEDEVMIHYSSRSNYSENFWLSQDDNCQFTGVCGDTQTRTCPGSYISSGEWQSCDWEVFTID